MDEEPLAPPRKVGYAARRSITREFTTLARSPPLTAERLVGSTRRVRSFNHHPDEFDVKMPMSKPTISLREPSSLEINALVSASSKPDAYSVKSTDDNCTAPTTGSLVLNSHLVSTASMVTWSVSCIKVTPQVELFPDAVPLFTIILSTSGRSSNACCTSALVALCPSATVVLDR